MADRDCARSPTDDTSNFKRPRSSPTLCTPYREEKSRKRVPLREKAQTSDGTCNVSARQVVLFSSHDQLPLISSPIVDDGSEEGASTSKYSNSALMVKYDKDGLIYALVNYKPHPRHPIPQVGI